MIQRTLSFFFFFFFILSLSLVDYYNKVQAGADEVPRWALIMIIWAIIPWTKKNKINE